MSKPLLIVVTGRVGSGKTTLAHALANQVHCPAFCRDEFKEGFVNTMGSSHDSLGKDTSWGIYETFFQAVELMAARGISLVVEAAWDHKAWAPKLQPLQDVSRMSIVICSVDPQVARARSIERGLADSTRERFHGDRYVRAAKEGIRLPVGSYDPPRLSVPTLVVDTADGYEPEMGEIVSFVMQSTETAAEQGGAPTT
jgi:predicted kinase